MMTSRSLICLLENQNGDKLQKGIFLGGSVISKFKYAPITSVKVERSFSPFKNMLIIQ
jgi:hypothetical protein